MKRILSGIQPTNTLTLGNYLGAIKNWVQMQNDAECFLFIADLHALTVPPEPAQLRKNTREVAAAYIASGIDSDRSTIFVQSHVPAHVEFSWMLSCLTPMGWLDRMTQFKDKVNNAVTNLWLKTSWDLKDEDKILLLKEITEREISTTITSLPIDKNISKICGEMLRANVNLSMHDANQALMLYIKNIMEPEKVNLGLYAYPTLMAADILLYHPTHVPVGEDQKQHLELTRDIAGAFNRQYKKSITEFHKSVLPQDKYFKLPEPVILGAGTRVMSLRDGNKKMSKSDASDMSRINLTDDADTIANKIKKATSDSDLLPDNVAALENRAEARNLVNIYAALSDITPDAVLQQFAGQGFGKFKPALAELCVEKLAPISIHLKELMQDTDVLDALLAKGAARANAVAEKTLKECKEIVGLLAG